MRALPRAWYGAAKAAVQDNAAYKAAETYVRRQVDTAREIASAVSASEVLQAAWTGVRTHLWLIVAFSAGINLLYLAPSLYMMQVYDRVLPTGGILTLILLSVVLIASLVVMAGLDALRTRLLARMSLRVERLAASPIMLEALRAKRSGAPGQIAGIREIDTLRNGISSQAMTGLLDIPWTPLFIFICFVIHFWIGVLALAGAVMIFGLALINERAARRGLQTLSAKAPAFYSAHDTDLQSADTIHALGADGVLLRKRLQAREELVDAQTETAFDNAGYSAATKAFRMGLQSAALGLGCFLAVQREISPGAIIAASILTARAFAPVEQVVAGWRQLGLAYAAFQTLRTVLERAKPDMSRTPLPEPQGRITAEGVAATAPGGRIVVQGVSFAAGPGEIIGIIGPSGAGKTSLARVLANATLPVHGAVRIDGARYADWDHAALAQHIGYLPQRIELFDGTVSENISTFARQNGAPMESVGPAVVEAAQRSGAHELIVTLPSAYETPLGLGGSGVSPGQAQRIALARAFYGEPKVIVLDEPNSHLDSDGELALVKALEGARARGATCFIVAHRAGVINVCDKLIVLNEGRLAEYGPREEVMAKLTGARRAAPKPVSLSKPQ